MVMVVVDSEGVSSNINTAAAIYHGQARGGIYGVTVITGVIETAVDVLAVAAGEPATD